MERHTPAFDHVLVDLSQLDVSVVTPPGLLRSGMLTLKHVFDRTLGDVLPEIYAGLASSAGLSFVKQVTLYVMRAARSVEPIAVLDAASKTLPIEGVQAVQTVAEKLIARGKA